MCVLIILLQWWVKIAVTTVDTIVFVVLFKSKYVIYKSKYELSIFFKALNLIGKYFRWIDQIVFVKVGANFLVTFDQFKCGLKKSKNRFPSKQYYFSSLWL